MKEKNEITKHITDYIIIFINFSQLNAVTLGVFDLLLTALVHTQIKTGRVVLSRLSEKNKLTIEV